MNWPDFNDLWDYNDPVTTDLLFRGLLADSERARDARRWAFAATSKPFEG
jgi:hypothetical protein